MGRWMNLLIYLCAAVILLLGIAFAAIVIDLIRDLWR